MRVSDTKRLARAAENLALDCEILSDTEAKLYGTVTVTALMGALTAEGCELISVSEHEESLENYFINLVGSSGGDANA